MTWKTFVIGWFIKNVCEMIIMGLFVLNSFRQTLDATQRPSRRQACTAETGSRVSPLSASLKRETYARTRAIFHRSAGFPLPFPKKKPNN